MSGVKYCPAGGSCSAAGRREQRCPPLTHQALQPQWEAGIRPTRIMLPLSSTTATQNRHIYEYLHIHSLTHANLNTHGSFPAQLGGKCFRACFAENYTRANTAEQKSQQNPKVLSSVSLPQILFTPSFHPRWQLASCSEADAAAPVLAPPGLNAHLSAKAAGRRRGRSAGTSSLWQEAFKLCQSSKQQKRDLAHKPLETLSESNQGAEEPSPRSHTGSNYGAG